MGKTTIEWTDFTFNPWIGCTKVSPGCDHCYAARQDLHRRWTVGGWGGPRRRTSEANWKQPLHWNRQAEREGRRFRVFCASLADVFDNQVPPEWRDELFGLMAATPNLDWLVLTKRISNAQAYLNDQAVPRRIDTLKHVILAGRLEERHAPERSAEVGGWPGYFITSKGRVLSDRTNAGTRGADLHEVKPQAGDAGHARVMLQVDGQCGRELVHRLVLTAFDRLPIGDEQGCHIDGDPSNNALWNLRWGNQSSNWDDSKRHGTRRRYSKVSPEDVIAIRQRAEAGETAAAISRDFPISDTQVRNILRGNQWKPEEPLQWPLPWVWLGATVVNQEEADRDIRRLLAIPARVHFVSYEPALGPVDLTPWLRPYCDNGSRPHPDGGGATCPRCGGVGGCAGVSWVIAGGESGPHARPMHPEWAASLRNQCRAAGVPFLFKQWGEWMPRSAMALEQRMRDVGQHEEFFTKLDGSTHWIDEQDSTPYDASDVRMVKVGKKAAGRLLDGVEHNGFPEVEAQASLIADDRQATGGVDRVRWEKVI